MMEDSRARLLLSHVVEAGDPRLRAELDRASPHHVWLRILAGRAVPESWQTVYRKRNSRNAATRQEQWYRQLNRHRRD